MSKELEAFRDILEILSAVSGCEVDRDSERIKLVNQALQRIEAIDNAKPSEALKWLEVLYSNAKIESGWVKERCITYAEEFEHNDRIKPYYEHIKQALLKAQEQEKENELLKEIIKSLFDRGCPLHQYTDKEGVLTIEVDSECSIMRLGVYKGVDLDKKLKEVLK